MKCLVSIWKATSGWNWLIKLPYCWLWIGIFRLVNPLRATGLLLYLKTSENKRFSDIFRRYKRRPVARNGLCLRRRNVTTYAIISLTLPVPCTSGGLKDLHKTFWGTTKKCKNKNLTKYFFFVWDWDRKG